MCSIVLIVCIVMYHKNMLTVHEGLWAFFPLFVFFLICKIGIHIKYLKEDVRTERTFLVVRQSR